MSDKRFSPYKTYRVVELDEYTWQVWGYGDKVPFGTYHDPDVAEAVVKKQEGLVRDEFMRGWGKAKVVNLNSKNQS